MLALQLKLWKRERVFEDEVFIENTCLGIGFKKRGTKFKCGRSFKQWSRGSPGQWFPETEYLLASAIFVVGTSGIPTNLNYRSVSPIPLEYVLIILFFLIWAYFHRKFVAFLYWSKYCVNFVFLDIIIIIMSCCQHRSPWPSLTTRLYRPSLLEDLQDYILYRHRAGRPAFARPCEGARGSMSLMSSSLLLRQCPASLVRLTLIVYVIGGRWLYSCCSKHVVMAYDKQV